MPPQVTLAYRIGSRYTFDPPVAADDLALVLVRLAPDAWLERTDAGETVVCTRRYRFGAKLMTAITLEFCTVTELDMKDDAALQSHDLDGLLT